MGGAEVRIPGRSRGPGEVAAIRSIRGSRVWDPVRSGLVFLGPSGFWGGGPSSEWVRR